ncbi:ATP-binding cassette domain-containing protein [Dactylosporangium sp. CA-092794]|uniref:ATP-binding cassette domain-containing protein n=1 Tax=Dactylosporangium sp. CA-092794 TaxID=3239929 RepID=UPI003D8D468F
MVPEPARPEDPATVPAVPDPVRKAGEAVLEVRNLAVRYGSVAALRGVDVKVQAGEIVALLGPNGAGKSSLARAITGMLPQYGGTLVSGAVVVRGTEVHRRPPSAIVKAGVSQVLEGRQTVMELTVEENLRIGGYTRRRGGGSADVLEHVLDLFPVLRQRLRDRAGYLSGGEQQMLVIGRALMQEPTVLVLDEPGLGLSPKMAAHIYRLIRQINEQGTSILLIEQNANAALAVSHYAYLLDSGRTQLEGSAAQVSGDEHVKNAYLGVGEGAQSYRAVLGLGGADEAPVPEVPGPADGLVVSGLGLRIGGINALSDVSFSVGAGEFFAVIGPNGAGKTSLLNSLSGFYRPQQGNIAFGGTPLLGKSPSKIARLGIARTFQNLALFGQLPVIDNVMVGRERFRRSGALAGAVWLGKSRREELRSREICSELIDLMGLGKVRNLPVGSLSYGQRKRVELARALASEPRLLLLDEPVAGMNFDETAELASYVLRAREEMRFAVLLVEHDLHLIMDIAERVLVLDFGQPIALGTPQAVRADPAVVAAYLGVSDAAEVNAPDAPALSLEPEVVL